MTTQRGLSITIVRAMALVFVVALFSTPGTSPAASVEDIALLKSADRQKILIEGAKKEGKVMFYTGLIVDQVVRPLKQAFEKEYPFIEVEFFRGNSQRIAQRVLAEYQAKRYDVDLISGSAATTMVK
ncbi:MAG: hypothetical protein ACREQV_02210, partial [Candidatus Binatia bacterium]